MNDTVSKKLAEGIIKLNGISTPVISDAMAKGLSVPLKHQAMEAAVKPVRERFTVCGRAYTVQCYPGATYAMEKAVAEAPAETVIVCDGQGSTAGVMMGGLMSTFAQQRGILGAVVDGSVRDIDDIDALNFPVFSRFITPRCGTADPLGDVEQPISCGGVVVQPGDIVAGDMHGVVVVPQGIIEAVATAAVALAKWESQVKEKIMNGMSLEAAVGSCEKPEIQQISLNGT